MHVSEHAELHSLNGAWVIGKTVGQVSDGTDPIGSDSKNKGDVCQGVYTSIHCQISRLHRTVKIAKLNRSHIVTKSAQLSTIKSSVRFYAGSEESFPQNQ